jgi:NDP-sugar pyrophosphorylase family protein
MKALILAGGFGTRLRPLSCTRPKLMFPIANRPLLDWTLERLAASGVKEVVLAVNYMAHVLKNYYGTTQYEMKISYSHETKPLGTAGPIKKAEQLIGRDSPFFVLNGDILSEIDYQALLKAHQENGATATITLLAVSDPSRFGVVEIDSSNRIHRFVEKPKPGETPSNLINAGVYALDPSVFTYIKPNEKVSMEREVFPVLAKEGKLFGYRCDKLWIDIGKPADYLQANRYMLDKISSKQPILGEAVEIKPNTKITKTVVIGNRVEIGEDAHIGPYAAIGENTVIGKGTRIENSIIFPGAWIDAHTSIRGAIIGEGAIIGQWVKIENGVIVGDHAIIYDNVTLTQEVTVCPSKEVDESVLEPRQVM